MPGSGIFSTIRGCDNSLHGGCNFLFAVWLNPVCEITRDFWHRPSWRSYYSRPARQCFTNRVSETFVKRWLNIRQAISIMLQLLFIGNHPDKLDLVFYTQALCKTFQFLQVITVFTCNN
ncbi:hypothetical protein A986_15616 [Pseudomonas fluorescens BRIP34879]|nr:hypothetical protein A986_15616 [Pseudomonas fluorescens BRIP34879]